MNFEESRCAAYTHHSVIFFSSVWLHRRPCIVTKNRKKAKLNDDNDQRPTTGRSQAFLTIPRWQTMATFKVLFRETPEKNIKNPSPLGTLDRCSWDLEAFLSFWSLQIFPYSFFGVLLDVFGLTGSCQTSRPSLPERKTKLETALRISWLATLQTGNNRRLENWPLFKRDKMEKPSRATITVPK